MKLENQVVSLELAKKLKELGVTQESLFFWRFSNDGGAEFELCYQPVFTYHEDNEYAACAYAFTVAELGEMLPAYVAGKRLQIDKMPNDAWMCGYVPLNDAHNEIAMVAETEADARAKMLIYLIENNLITV